MQRRTKIALALTGGLALAGIAAQPAIAQAGGPAWGCGESSPVACSRYVDEDGDGVCDNREADARPARVCGETRAGACHGGARSHGRCGR